MAAKPHDPHSAIHLCVGDHQTTWPCKFECTVGKHEWVMANVELPQNPRWPPNHTTYMVPNAPACGGPPDHVNLNMLRASISELWPLLSNCRIQDGHQTVQSTWHPMHLHIQDHQTTWPCQFECIAVKCKRVTGHHWVPTESKMAAKPCNLHGTQCTCTSGTTRPLNHANLNTLWASISESWPPLCST